MCLNSVNVLFYNEPEYWRVQALYVFKYLSTTYSSRLHNGAKHSTQMNDHRFSLSCCNKFLIQDPIQSCAIKLSAKVLR